MIKIHDFNNLPLSGVTYGGHGGTKKGVVIDGEKWFLKYPKSTKSMEVENISYTTTPLSEYLGSQIYASIGLPVHETILGITNEKLVVACKDFLSSYEVILDYNSLKNDHDDKLQKELESLSSASINNNDIEEIILVMEKNAYFKQNPELKNHFWDMFIIDAFINNNDRNEGNWGLVLNKENGEIKIAPVFDNGAAFYNKSDNNRLLRVISDEVKIKQSFYDSSISVFLKDGKIINPLKYIESMENKDCNAALLRVLPKINLEKIKNIFEEVPNEYNGITIMSDLQKEVYLKSLIYKYEKVLFPTYEKLIKN